MPPIRYAEDLVDLDRRRKHVHTFADLDLVYARLKRDPGSISDDDLIVVDGLDGPERAAEARQQRDKARQAAESAIVRKDQLARPRIHRKTSAVDVEQLAEVLVDVCRAATEAEKDTLRAELCAYIDARLDAIMRDRNGDQ